MPADTALRLLALCLMLASAETLHGIARTVLVVPRIGKARATQWSALTGSLLALVICWFLVPPLELRGAAQHLGLGLFLATYMAAFDLAIGRLVMHKPWHTLWPDFDPRSGNFLSLGLAFLVVAPALVQWGRGTV